MDKNLASVIRHLFIASLLFGISFAGVAQKDSKSVQSLKRQQQTTKQQIANTNKQIDKTKKSQISALHKLEALSAEIAQVNDSIGALNAEIADLSAAEKKLADDVAALERNLEVKKKSYANAIRSMTVRRDSRFDALMFIFSAHSLEQAYRRFRYLQEFSAWRKQEAHEIAAQRDEINRQRSALKQMQNERKFALTQRTRMSNRLTRQKKEQNVLIAGLKKKEKELQQELKRQQRQAEALERRIQEIIKEEARKAAEKAAAEKAAADKNDKTSTGYKMSQDEINLSQNFAANKGKLPTPLSGRYRIVSHYGTHQHPDLKYVKINNQGIDLQTTAGVKARAVFDGTVTAVFVVPGYNTSVIVRHGEYLTIYSNLSELYVKKGDKVNTRQDIGLIYSDPEEDNRTVLHFQLRKGEATLNPELWLKQ